MKKIKESFMKNYDGFYYQNNRKFCFLSEAIRWIQIRYGLNISPDEIKEMFVELGFLYENKHVRFEDNSTKSDRILYVEHLVTTETYPVRNSITKNSSLIYFLDKIITDHRTINESKVEDIIDMGIYLDDEGNKVLMFHNKVMRDHIMNQANYYNFNEDHMKRMMTILRRNSEKSYIRRNVYTEKSSTIQDKVFYKYDYRTELV